MIRRKKRGLEGQVEKNSVVCRRYESVGVWSLNLGYHRWDGGRVGRIRRRLRYASEETARTRSGSAGGAGSRIAGCEAGSTASAGCLRQSKGYIVVES